MKRAYAAIILIFWTRMVFAWPLLGPWQVSSISNSVHIPTTTVSEVLTWLDSHWPTNIPDESLATELMLSDLAIGVANTASHLRAYAEGVGSNVASNVHARIDGILSEWPYKFLYVRRAYVSGTTGVYYSASSGTFSNILWTSEAYTTTNLLAGFYPRSTRYAFQTTGLWMAHCSIVLQKMPIVATNDFNAWVLIQTVRNGSPATQDTVGAGRIFSSPVGIGFNGSAIINVPEGESIEMEVIYEADPPFQLVRLVLTLFYLGR